MLAVELSPHSDVLAAARRYHTLDALRGVAAIVVMIGHTQAWFGIAPLPHYAAAVDLFFLLSGFVLAEVYEKRFSAGMNARQFMSQRYIRLYPLYLIGTLIGAATGILALLGHLGELSASALCIAVVAGLLMVPSPTWASTNEVMPLNNPGWSLIFELAVNAIFAFTWRFLSNAILFCIVAASAATLAVLDAHNIRYGGNWWSNIHIAVPRVCFSFFAGVLISRFHRPGHLTSEWAWVLPVALFSSLVFRTPLERYANITLVLVGFPLLILIAIKVEPQRSRLMAFLGAISYPLYAVHQPLFRLCKGVAAGAGLGKAPAPPVSGAVFLCAVIVLAFILDRYWDRPIRDWLGRKVARRRA